MPDTAVLRRRRWYAMPLLKPGRTECGFLCMAAAESLAMIRQPELLWPEVRLYNWEHWPVQAELAFEEGMGEGI